jgi:hypothetical protein
MLELLSIHIPKTGGTSFYDMLRQAYGEEAVGISYRRRDVIKAREEYGSLAASIPPSQKVLHGHLFYYELKEIHQLSGAKVICWLRDPIERVISNYRFFIHRLQNPEINPAVYELNKHRVNESLLKYASYRENRNVMSQYLKGLPLEQIDFIGFLDHFEEDVQRLEKILNWERVQLPHLNKGAIKRSHELTDKEVQKLTRWNKRDITLYNKAKELSGRF